MGSGRMSMYGSGSLVGRVLHQASYDTRRWWYALLLLSLASSLVFLYLFEAGRVARLNDEMENLEFELSTIEKANSALVLRIADAVQLPLLKQRARTLGFGPPQHVEYVEVWLDEPVSVVQAGSALPASASPEPAAYGAWQTIWRQFSEWMGRGSAQPEPLAR